MADVFLSYAQPDKEMASKLTSGLEARGISVWSEKNILAGDDIESKVLDAVINTKNFVALISDYSSRSNSFRQDLSVALAAKEADSRRLILPVSLKVGAEDIPFIRRFKSIDLTKSEKFEAALDELQKAILRSDESVAGAIISREISSNYTLNSRIEHERLLDLQRDEQKFAERAIIKMRYTEMIGVAAGSFTAVLAGISGAFIAFSPFGEIVGGALTSSKWTSGLSLFNIGVAAGVGVAYIAAALMPRILRSHFRIVRNALEEESDG